jgi:predicted component of type VI protein secretion system
MRYSIFLLCAMVSVLLAGCISPGQPDVQPKPTTIKVAINDWAGFAPLYIAQQQNLFGT